MTADVIVRRELTARERQNFPKPYRPAAYHMGNCSIYVGHEPVNGDESNLRWHLSIAHPWRLPTWEEMKQVRAQLLPPDVHFCIPMPPEPYWISVHDFCLHLYEVVDAPLTAQWELEASARTA